MVPVQFSVVSVVDGGNSSEVFEMLEGVASGSQDMINIVEIWFVPLA